MESIKYIVLVAIIAILGIGIYEAATAPETSVAADNTQASASSDSSNPSGTTSVAGAENSNATPSPASKLPELSKLLECPADGQTDCSNDYFQKVWMRFEADNGEVTKLDTKSIVRSTSGIVDAAIYTFVPGSMFQASRVRLLAFTCQGEYQDLSAGISSPWLDAPPNSVIGNVAAVACSSAMVPARPNDNRGPSGPPNPADYCNGFTPDECDRITSAGKSDDEPAYCTDGFAREGSGLSNEQIQSCNVFRAFHLNQLP